MFDVSRLFRIYTYVLFFLRFIRDVCKVHDSLSRDHLLLMWFLCFSFDFLHIYLAASQSSPLLLIDINDWLLEPLVESISRFIHRGTLRKSRIGGGCGNPVRHDMRIHWDLSAILLFQLGKLEVACCVRDRRWIVKSTLYSALHSLAGLLTTIWDTTHSLCIPSALVTSGLSCQAEWTTLRSHLLRWLSLGE